MQATCLKNRERKRLAPLALHTREVEEVESADVSLLVEYVLALQLAISSFIINCGQNFPRFQTILTPWQHVACQRLGGRRAGTTGRVGCVGSRKWSSPTP